MSVMIRSLNTTFFNVCVFSAGASFGLILCGIGCGRRLAADFLQPPLEKPNLLGLSGNESQAHAHSNQGIDDLRLGLKGFIFPNNPEFRFRPHGKGAEGIDVTSAQTQIACSTSYLGAGFGIDSFHSGRKRKSQIAPALSRAGNGGRCWIRFDWRKT